MQQAHDRAKSAEKQGKYTVAVKELEAIPEHLRDQKLFVSLCTKIERVAALDTEITTAVKQMETAGLRSKVEELLELQPQRADLRRLLDKLPMENPTAFTNSVGIKFVLVPHGTFWMSEDHENARKQVEVPHDFYIGVYQVTQEQWQALMGYNASMFTSTGKCKNQLMDFSDEDLQQFPVECVSWYDVQKFIKKLNSKDRSSAWTYRLPTVSEWEYACRGGASSKYDCSFDYYFSDATNQLSSNQANFNNSIGHPTKVGSYSPNVLGVYDMHGNVWEWCSEWHTEGRDRAIRGGSWFSIAAYCRTACRNGDMPACRMNSLGFRLVLVPKTTSSKAYFPALTVFKQKFRQLVDKSMGRT